MTVRLPVAVQRQNVAEDGAPRWPDSDIRYLAGGETVKDSVLTPKRERPCCANTEDEYHRLCIGFCSPECIGRSERDAAIAAQGTDPNAKYRRRYTADERTMALAVVTAVGITAAAKRLDISESTLREWRWFGV